MNVEIYWKSMLMNVCESSRIKYATIMKEFLIETGVGELRRAAQVRPTEALESADVQALCSAPDATTARGLRQAICAARR